MANTASRAKIVQRWASERIGVAIVLLVVLGTAALLVKFNIPAQATGQFNPGQTFLSETGHFRVHTLHNRGGGEGVCGNFCQNLNLNLQPGSTVRWAAIGMMIEGGPRPNPIPNIPAFEAATNLSVTYNDGADSTSAAAWSRQLNVESPPSRMQWVLIPTFVRDNGSGNYRLSESWVNQLGACCWPTQFMIVVEQNPTFPLNQVAINSYFYGRRGSTLPADIVANVELPGLPEGFFQGSGAIWTLGAFFNEFDCNSGYYTMGAASGPLPRVGPGNAGNSACSWLPEGWGQYTVPDMDKEATDFTMRVRWSSVQPGNGDSASWLIFQSAPFTVGLPEPPVVVTDNCYDEE